MKPPFCTAVVLLVMACAAGGCAMLRRPTSDTTNSLDAAGADTTAAQTGAAKSAPAGPAPKWPAATQPADLPTTNAATTPGTAGAGGPASPTGKSVANSAPANKQALTDVLAELAAMGALEPEAQQRLIADLRTTDPALWPGVIETFRATLAYRRRAADRAQTAAKSAADPRAELDGRAEITMANLSPVPSRSDRAQALASETSNAAHLPANATMDGGSATAAPIPTRRDGPEAVASGEHGARQPGAPEPGLLRPGTESSPVHQASHSSPATASAPSAAWQQQLGPAIAELEKQTRASPSDADAVARHVWLRMLYLAAGRRDDALRPIPGISPAQQDYWSKQIFALATYLDSQRVGDPGLRAAEAVQHLTRAAASLAEQAPLVVRNLAFCTAVDSYGVHKPMEQHEFKPDQELLVYAEVENFKAEEAEKGYHTALQPSYQILDSQGKRVDHGELPLTEEICGNRRRDYFVRYFIRLPKTMYDGAYKLEWTIEDTLGRKIGQSTIDFTIKQKK